MPIAAPSRGPIPKKVLVVEDIALIRMTTTDMVEEIGYRTVEAGSGEEALAALAGDAEISVLLTDLGLPGMSGQQLIEKALKIRPDIKVVVASGSEFESSDFSGQIAKLIKPFDIEQLRRALAG